MKPFESFMAPKLEEFLDYRHTIGYSTKSSTIHLRAFDRYLKEREADWSSFKPSFFLEMRSELSISPHSINQVIKAARGFFKFLQRREYVEENPLQDIPLLKENTSVPFIFSPEQTNQLLEAVSKRIRRSERFFLTDLAIYMAILLLARCGMRISEPLRLLRNHYRSDDGTVYIEKTKFKKNRLIPAPKAAMREIENYLAVRNSLLPHDENPYLLAGKKHKPLTGYQVRCAFHQAVKDIALEQTKKVIGNMTFSQPTPHSLRHSFAINTLFDIKERGDSPQDVLHILSAYLGHTKYHYSSVYLKVANAKSRKNLLDFTLWQQWKNI
jgi:site-specific recombinase XerD